MKTCTLIIAESGRQFPMAINPGTTPYDIKQELAIPDSYQIGKPNQKIFQDNEPMYEEVHEGEELFASTPVRVGDSDEDKDDEKDDDKDSASSFLKNIIRGLKPPIILPLERKFNLSTFNGNLFKEPIPYQIQTHPMPALYNYETPVSHPRKNIKVLPTTKRNAPKKVDEFLWKKKGWVKANINTFEGFYAGGEYRLKGKAKQSPSGRLDLFIYNPPQKLLRKHPHGPCFTHIQHGLYSIHNNNTGYFDLSSAIIQIEQILKETSEL